MPLWESPVSKVNIKTALYTVFSHCILLIFFITYILMCAVLLMLPDEGGADVNYMTHNQVSLFN